MRRLWLPLGLLAACGDAQAVTASGGATSSTASVTTTDTGATTDETDSTGAQGTHTGTFSTEASVGSTGAASTDHTGGTGGTTALTPGCPLGDVMLKTQADVEAVAGCTDFPGALRVLTGVTDLAPLAGVRHIAGTLTIGGVLFGTEANVTSLDAFSELETVGGLDFTDIPVPDLLPFSKLTAVPGDVSVCYLPSLAGLQNITEIGGRLHISGYDLTDLTGLAGLQRVGGGMQLDNLSLVDLHGLEALSAVGTPGADPVPVRIMILPNLTSLDALNFPWHDAIDFELYDTAVPDLGFFSGTTELHGLHIEGSDLIPTLAGLESLVEVRGELEIFHAGLTDISALAGLKSVGTLTLTSPAFADLSPLASLTHVGALRVTHSKYTDLGPSPTLQQIGGVELSFNDQLVELSLLKGLTVLDRLVIDHNKAMVDLEELSGLEHVAGDVNIRGNAALADLADLAALASVDGRLAVVANPSLPQVDALAWAAPIAVGDVRKIAGNKDAGPPAEPCPWVGDGECDEGYICAEFSDSDDCGGG